MAQLHRHGTITWYSTIVREWYNYMGMAQLHRYMAQLNGIAQLSGLAQLQDKRKEAQSTSHHN